MPAKRKSDGGGKAAKAVKKEVVDSDGSCSGMKKTVSLLKNWMFLG